MKTGVMERESDRLAALAQLSKGKPALLNVWATWCVACRVEHPVLNKLAKKGVTIYGVNYKDDNVAAQKWLGEFYDPRTEERRGGEEWRSRWAPDH